MKIRSADFAGSWYPSSSSACEREIKSFLKEEQIKVPSSTKLVGGIVPHAGWYFVKSPWAILSIGWKTVTRTTKTNTQALFFIQDHQ